MTNDFSSVIVTFGRHKGKSIEDIPSDYLKWLAENADNDSIATAADDEYNWREDHGAHWE